MGGLCLYSAGNFRLLLEAQISKSFPVVTVPTKSTKWYKHHEKYLKFQFFLFPLDPSATLLTIVDAEENAFVSAHIKENDLITKNVWLGLAQSSKGKK